MRYKAIEVYIPKVYPVKDSQLYHSEIGDVAILTNPHDPQKVYSSDDKDYFPVTGTDLYRSRGSQKFTTDQESLSFWFMKIVPETSLMFNIDVFLNGLYDILPPEQLISVSWYPLKQFIQDALDLPR